MTARGVENNPRVREVLETFEERQAQCRGFAAGLGDLLHELPPTESLAVEDATLVVLLQRATGWLHSVGKLDAVFDYQGHSAACRALLEVAVDVALISHEPALHERMKAYEESQLFKAAVKYREFVRRRNIADADRMQLGYIDANEQRIMALRLQYWPDPGRPGRGMHPKTWYGPSLPEVAAEADRRVGSQYERFYFEHYDRLCWGTHGSSLMLVRRHPPDMLPSVALMAILGSQKLAMDLTRRVLRFLGHDDAAIGDQLVARQLNAAAQRHVDALMKIASSPT